jgi:hypothetical protein
MLESEFKLDSGIIGFKCIWQFTGDVSISIIIPSITLIRGVILLLLGSGLLQNGSVILERAF